MMMKYRLDKLCEINSGGTPSRRKKEYYNEGKIPWAKIRDIESSNGTIYDTEEKITIEGLKSIRNKLFPKGSLLISIYGSVGKVAFTGVDMSSNQAILGIRLNKEGENKLSLEYLKYWFEINLESLKNRAVGGILKNISASIVRGLEIPLPSLNDQKRIAQVLSNCESLIQKRKESIALLDELLKSTFLEMFGDPIEMNKKNLEKLENHIEYLTSGSRGWAKYYSDEGPKFLRIKNLGFGVLNEKDVQKVNPPKSAESIRTIVEEGDLLISITADLGRTAVVPKHYGEAYINQHLALVRLKESLNPRYAAYYFAMPFGNRMIQKKDKDGVKSGLTFKDIKNFDIYMPEIIHQKKFEIIFNQIQELKISYNNHLEELENLYGSISQKGFKGELDLSKVKISSICDFVTTNSDASDSILDIKTPVAGSLEPPKNEDKRPRISKKELENLKITTKGKRDITNTTYLDFIGIPTEIQRRNYADDYSIETDFINEKLFIQFYLKDNFKNKEFTLSDVEISFNSYFIPKGQDFDYESWKEFVFDFIEAKPPLLEQLFDRNDNTVKLKLTDEAFKA
ncbi:restriction endonuclease subunit S [Cellulophaga sp. HaHa_2_95]|uniref:restriction endonuclease subunit S n=1 Tax=Cellulophaga sp. HaHa_2_95 TaxID=2745558 RepID=UPI001C4E7723|nr:restriction endonuclease subunit S [Cellulophaga sp. HaHa_2_95]QXP54658.1 restriction endonuclease subunit S [Cellulophaga sp. HaHa_2_95]